MESAIRPAIASSQVAAQAGEFAFRIDSRVPGFDGGDCPIPDEVPHDCKPGNVGDGVCQPECNFAQFNWDGGEFLIRWCQRQSYI